MYLVSYGFASAEDYRPSVEMFTSRLQVKSSDVLKPPIPGSNTGTGFPEMLCFFYWKPM